MTLRGRGASPVRPGSSIKGVLLGEIPLASGELVTEASISDLAGAYKELIRRENTLRSKEKRLRGMTYRSFLTLFKFSQLLGLVELVREEPMLYPPPGGPLYSIRKPNGVHVVTSARRIFKLTDIGREDERSWTNLCRAWREDWPRPAKVEYAPPYIPPPVKPPKPPVPPEVFTPYKWVTRPSIAQFKSLLAHLETLRSIGISKLEVVEEVDRLATLMGDWVIEIEDSLEDARTIMHISAIERLEEWHKHVTVVSEALMDRNLDKAVRGIGELIK